MVLVPTFYISKNILCSITTNDKNETIFINSLLSKMKNLLCVYFHLLLLLSFWYDLKLCQGYT